MRRRTVRFGFARDDDRQMLFHDRERHGDSLKALHGKIRPCMRLRREALGRRNKQARTSILPPTLSEERSSTDTRAAARPRTMIVSCESSTEVICVDSFCVCQKPAREQGLETKPHCLELSVTTSTPSGNFRQALILTQPSLTVGLPTLVLPA